jgi:nitrous oxidase accessory protein NosD
VNPAATYKVIFALLLAFFISLTFSTSEAKVIKATCSPTKGINAAILKAKPRDVINVTGICNENVFIPAHISGITIDGQGSTTINAANAGPFAVRVLGSDITLKNLVISGGSIAVYVASGASVIIDSNTVKDADSVGVNITHNSVARIVNSTIQNNGGCGVNISEGSAGRIGYRSHIDTEPSPNIIVNNGYGVCVSRSSNARVVGSNISGNTLDGIYIDTVSHADISGNAIDGNGRHGILLTRNSGINLGLTTGPSVFQAANTTAASNNTGYGLSCSINSYAEGALGSLNGSSGTVQFANACINATAP